MAYEVATFEEDVLRASHDKPVLVDFWAPWCGPCRVLGPILEKLAAETDEWQFIKINTDQHQDLSRRYGIRGIPAVKLFAEGEVIDEFTGVLPEPAIRQWLEKALPSESKKRVAQAEDALAGGDTQAARALLEQVLQDEPNNPKGQLLMAQLLVFEDPDRAEALAEGAAFAGPGFVQVQEAVQTLAALLRTDPADLPEGPAADAFGQAVKALRRQDFAEALERFIEVIQQDRYYQDDAARKACIALFTLLGPQHDATRAYRRRFDMALY